MGCRCSGFVDGGGHAEVGGAVGAVVDLGELVFGAGEADFEAFGFAEPAFAFGFGDAGKEVVADLGDAGPLGGVWPVQGAAQAGVLVDAGGADGAAAEEGQVGLDRFLGVGGLVAEGDVDVAVPGDYLGDVRWEPVEDRVGEEHPAEVVGGVVQWLAAGAGQAGAGEGGGEQPADGGGGDGAVLASDPALA